MYVRNYGEGCGLPWQTVFQTDDRGVVEAYCAEHELEFEWKGAAALRTRAVRPAIVRHPRTGEDVWFNHATFFHVSTLAEPLREALLAQFAEQDLPNNTYYGDGSPIEPEVLDELRAAYLEETIIFPWRRGDVLFMDNVLMAHGRRPFVGERRILVGMAQPFSWREVQAATTPRG
jgi:alpha-ketoglutarate-dependent taurine dioxygenase